MDDKQRLQTEDDFTEGLKTIGAAQAVDDDAAEIAADDAGASATAQKIDKLGKDGKPPA